MQPHNPHPHAPADATPAPRVIKFQFALLIAGSIVISLVLVTVGMYLYNESGAAQLDLSRPGYQDVRSQAQQAERFDGINATGDVDSETLKKFDELYTEQQAEILKRKDGFSSSHLSDKYLEIEVQ